ncbi:DUF3383 family protein [Sporosarcina sp. FSL K6-1508]|uniref:DUF3383 family protein n=1 Tax=Sporosarcina sp. FSL K6-1508 TaxID=2921553 RepID=UPI0030FC8A2C
MRYVDVQITRETKPISEKGFGLPLIIGTTGDKPYKVYREIEDVATDYIETTKEYKMASRMFGQEPRPQEIAMFSFDYDSVSDGPTALVAAMNELVKKHKDFYYLTCVEQGDEEITALADWASTSDRIYGATTPNIALAETLKGQYDNLFIEVHDQPEFYVAEGLIATCAPREIGSFTWTFKNVKGVPAVGYDNSEINAIEAANASTYIEEAGILMNSHGVVTSGEYIDIIQATHFLKARMAESVFRLLALKEKVPYTDAGIALVVAEIEGVLNQAFKMGIVADEVGIPLFSITPPRRKDIPKNTIAKRILPDLRWRCVVAGAIENVEIRGVLSL